MSGPTVRQFVLPLVCLPAQPFYLWHFGIPPCMQRTATFLGLCAILTACSTDLKINAPYKNVTVVEGLLNMRDSLHFIKINKGYLGEGDALVYAQVQDSNEWSVDAFEYARVVRRLNGQEVGSFPLQDTVVGDRQPGTFYAPTQRMYYFADPFREIRMIGGVPTTLFLDGNSEYSVELKIKGEEVSSSTTIVNDFSFQQADQSTDQVINLISGSDFGTFELNWTTGRNGKRYVADYRVNYREVRNGVQGDLKTVMRRVGTVVKRGVGSNEAMAVVMDGRRFYDDLAASIPSDPEVQQRIFLGVDFVISVANDEFHTFLTLTEPISGIIEDRPTYSNIENGYGIFGSRYVKSIIGKRLGPNSLTQLAAGDITGHLRFCSGMPGDVLSPHYCP